MSDWRDMPDGDWALGEAGRLIKEAEALAVKQFYADPAEIVFLTARVADLVAEAKMLVAAAENLP